MVPNDRKLQQNLCLLLILAQCCCDWEWQEVKASRQDVEQLVELQDLNLPVQSEGQKSQMLLTTHAHSPCKSQTFLLGKWSPGRGEGEGDMDQEG